MAEEKKSFKDLLAEAPLASSENTVTLVGALARSSQPEKFVLALGQGNSVTLDIASVKSHRVLGGGVGQLLVELEVDSSQVPEEAKRLQPQMPITGFVDVKHPPHETGVVDVKHPWTDLVATTPAADTAPFALATEQQAAADPATAMQAYTTVHAFDTLPHYDKPPKDSTGQFDTGRWPYWD